jgi:sulfite reductase (ferredoxin)
MSHIPEPILHIPETVREDVLAYREKAAAFVRGETNPTAFKAYRVPMGIYEQRTDGRFMVRVRLGAGLVPRQWCAARDNAPGHPDSRRVH